MELFVITLVISALLCSLVAGFVFCFAIVVMPGIRLLGDLDYLKSFKAMDGIIQDNQPVFMLVWLGSALTTLAATVLGLWHLDGVDLELLIFACAIFILGVHVPTVAINIPLNNRLSTLDLDTISQRETAEIAALFKTRWTRSNSFRTLVAILTTILLLVLLVRL